MNPASTKTVLVTGANGLLGQKVVNVFAPHYRVVATGLEPGGMNTQDTVTYISLDITDYGATQEVLEEYQPTYVINCAAYTDVDGAEEHRAPAWKVNATAVKKMARYLRRRSCKLVQISTDYIFQGNDGPYSEAARPDPVNYYGTSKLAAENEIKASGVDHCILRTNVLYGAAPGVKNNFVLWVLKSLQNNKPIRVVDDQLNNPTLANGLAECIMMACVMNAQGVYNYAGTDLLNRYDFARKIAQHFHLPLSLISPCKTKDLNQNAPRPLQSGLVTDKVVENLHIRLYDIEAGLQQVEKDLQQCEI